MKKADPDEVMNMTGVSCRWRKVVLLLGVAIGLNACAPRRAVTPPAEAVPAPGRAPQALPSQVVTEAEPLDLSSVDREIQRRHSALVAAKAKRAELSGTRRAVLDAWITAVEDQVERLKEISAQARSRASVTDPQERARRSQRLAALLLECLALAPLDPPVPSGARVVEETRVSWEPLREAFQKGDCTWLLQEHEALSKTHAQVVTPQDVEVMRGICLGRAGRKAEALKILEPLMKQGAIWDVQQVRYLTANWLFEEGQLEAAAERYRALLDAGQDRERWAEMAKLRLEQIRLRKGEIAPPQVAAGRPAESAQPTGQEPQAPPLSFPPREPLPLPTQQPSPVVERPQELQGTVAPGTVPSPGSQMEPPSSAPAQEVQLARLQEAQRLLDAERYEEAIRTFQQVKGQDYQERAQKGIQEAQDRYAEKRRKEAASLVLKAREEGGPNKKANLIKALEILEETNRAYPNNRYSAKIQQNIQDVIAQIRAIDPGFRR